MDEEKRKYLEELRKQIDPTVLSKMMDYMGGDENGAARNGSPAEIIRERQAARFQERIAKRKRVNTDRFPAIDPARDQRKSLALVLCGSEIRSRIVANQCTVLGISDVRVFTDMPSMFRHIMENRTAIGEASTVLVVSMGELEAFLSSWRTLRGAVEGQEAYRFIHALPIICIVESWIEVQDPCRRILGEERILCLTDEIASNREKIGRLLGSSGSA